MKRAVNPRSLANLRPAKPGDRLNPGGRPKKKPITEAYEQLMRTRLPDKLRTRAELPKGATWADLVARGIANAAVKGKADCAKEIADRLEGRALPEVREIQTIRAGTQIETPAGPQKVVIEVEYAD